MNGGLVFAAAKVAKLWSAEKFLFGHIENKLIFQEPQPYHSQKLKYGMNFEIYLQAFKVCNEDKFLPEAKALYLDLCLTKKREPEWDIFARAERPRRCARVIDFCQPAPPPRPCWLLLGLAGSRALPGSRAPPSFV